MIKPSIKSSGSINITAVYTCNNHVQMHDEMDIKLDKKTDVQDHEYKWKLYYDF